MSAAFYPPVGGALAAVDAAEGVVYDSKCVVIEGVVSPIGQGGWPGRDGYDVHNFTFACWRQLGDSLVAAELTLLRPVPPFSEGHKIFEQIPDFSIQRLSVLLSKDQTRAVVDKVLAADDPDESLRSYAEHLRVPVVISTQRFGDVVLNPAINWFEGKGKWNRKTIDLHFEKGEDGGIAEAIETAEALWRDQTVWRGKVEDFAVAQLLRLKNESWLDEDELEVTPTAFKARMKLMSMSFARNGRFEFWHEDGDLFCGHSIQISGNLRDGLTRADIPG